MNITDANTGNDLFVCLFTLVFYNKVNTFQVSYVFAVTVLLEYLDLVSCKRDKLQLLNV